MNNDEKTLDELFQELDELIEAMEKPGVSLEDSFQMYRKGVDLVKVCNDKLNHVEKKMLVVDEEGETHEFK